ncbi:coiled-coil domain-containing protein 34 [Rhinatrema bivittatum]|uniref:coiled-coil domain-containing protein 34 n=1 Tax=Rhinatrema bivittatum TaxID=194408 RepID=UPI00112B9C57|nr:coiled-coil domain-containing protein 34 [Rhinatrema bivittatum]
MRPWSQEGEEGARDADCHSPAPTPPPQPTEQQADGIQPSLDHQETQASVSSPSLPALMFSVGGGMPDAQSKDRSSGISRSHSTPRKQIAEKEKGLWSKIYHVSSSGDSTSSLVSPIYHDSFENDIGEGKEASIKESSHKANKGIGFEGIPNKDKERAYWQGTELSPWEEWLLNKERKERIRLQSKFLEDTKKQEEQIKEKQQQEVKKKIAEEKHKEWIARKNEQDKKQKVRLNKELKKKKSKELQKAELEEKGKEKYKEWLKKKQAEERERKVKQKEEEEKQLAELQEKKEKSKKIFEEWLQSSRTKPRPILNSFSYTNGKLTGYYDGNSYPSPSFFNPVPWKPIQAPPPSRDIAFLMRKNKQVHGSLFGLPHKTKESSVPKIKRA